MTSIHKMIWSHRLYLLPLIMFLIMISQWVTVDFFDEMNDFPRSTLEYCQEKIAGHDSVDDLSELIRNQGFNFDGALSPQYIDENTVELYQLDRHWEKLIATKRLTVTSESGQPIRWQYYLKPAVSSIILFLGIQIIGFLAIFWCLNSLRKAKSLSILFGLICIASVCGVILSYSYCINAYYYMICEGICRDRNRISERIEDLIGEKNRLNSLLDGIDSGVIYRKDYGDSYRKSEFFVGKKPVFYVDFINARLSDFEYFYYSPGNELAEVQKLNPGMLFEKLGDGAYFGKYTYIEGVYHWVILPWLCLVCLTCMFFIFAILKIFVCMWPVRKR